MHSDGHEDTKATNTSCLLGAPWVFLFDHSSKFRKYIQRFMLKCDKIIGILLISFQ